MTGKHESESVTLRVQVYPEYAEKIRIYQDDGGTMTWTVNQALELYYMVLGDQALKKKRGRFRFTFFRRNAKVACDATVPEEPDGWANVVRA